MKTEGKLLNGTVEGKLLHKIRLTKNIKSYAEHSKHMENKESVLDSGWRYENNCELGIIKTQKTACT